VADLEDAPVGRAPARSQIRQAAEDQRPLCPSGVVKGGVGEGDVADRVSLQPDAIAVLGEVAVVEEVVAGRVELSQPAAGEAEGRCQIGRLPVVGGGGDLDPADATVVVA